MNDVSESILYTNESSFYHKMLPKDDEFRVSKFVQHANFAIQCFVFTMPFVEVMF